MSSLLAIIAVLFFGVFDFSAQKSDQQPNTVPSMYERSESKLCGKKPSTFKVATMSAKIASHQVV